MHKIDFGYLGCIEIINKVFANYVKRAKILAYISHPKMTKKNILSLIEEIKKGCESEDAKMVIENSIISLYHHCEDESIAKKIYNEIYNYSQKNLIPLNENIFKEIFYYILNAETSKYQRQQTRGNILEDV